MNMNMNIGKYIEREIKLKIFLVKGKKFVVSKYCYFVGISMFCLNCASEKEDRKQPQSWSSLWLYLYHTESKT